MPVFSPHHPLSKHVSNEKVESMRGVETHAIILQFNHAGCIATRHEVIDQQGRKALGAGKGVGPAGIKALLSKISSKSPSEVEEFELIPANVLINTSALLCWYCAPQKRTLWFLRNKAKVAIPAAPLPALLFTTNGRTLWIHALADDKRPDKNTTLYHAPFFNVHQNASFCIGGADAPNTTLAKDMLRWESCLFDALFTHSHHSQTFQSHKPISDTQHIKMWRERASVGEPFRSSDLAPNGHTLGEFLKYATE